MSQPTILFSHLTKQFKSTLAISDFSAEVSPGRVTGFLGPNGAGKSTTLKCLLGLITPTKGESLLNGFHYQELKDPIRHVGALLENRGFHPGLTATQNLSVLASAAGIAEKRIDEVLDLVELDGAKNRRTRNYSLGMKQRLSLAMALLGDPEILILDEPANGLDPRGNAWLRSTLFSLASEGRTVLISSHQLADMQTFVDDVIIIDQGLLVASGTLDEIQKGRTLEEAFLDLTSNDVK